MRQITKDQLDKIQSLARQLGEAIDEAGCRILARMGDCGWSSTLLIVPEEIEMGECGRDVADDEEEIEPIDDSAIPSLPISCTVYSTEINSLYEEGDCARNYF